MSKPFRPMLAPSDSPMRNPRYFQDLKLPLYASPKFDGIRCLPKSRQGAVASSDLEMVPDGPFVDVCLSKSLIALPSKQVQTLFSPFQDLDGEVTVGDPAAFNVYNLTQSHVMSIDKPADDIRFLVFDSTDEELKDVPFETRREYVADQVEYFRKLNPASNVEIVKHVLCRTLDDIYEYEYTQLALGYEGVMLMSPTAPYKYGRGTFKEGYNYKLKREQDDEAIIVGFIEQTTNTNEATENELGLTKRSTRKEGLIGAKTVGKFVVDFNGVILEIAPGAATHAQRKYIWDHQELFIGKMITFRHFGHGAKHVPRFGRFVAFKDKMNLSL